MLLTLGLEKPCSTCLPWLMVVGMLSVSHMYSLRHQNYRNYQWANLLKRKFSNVFTFYPHFVLPLNPSSLLPILAPWMSSSPSPWVNSYSRVCCHTFPLWHQTAMIPLYLGPPFLVLWVSTESGWWMELQALELPPGKLVGPLLGTACLRALAIIFGRMIAWRRPKLVLSALKPTG